MVYDKLHDSSHPNAELLDKLYKDVEACNENYTNVIVSYKNSIDVTFSDVFACCIMVVCYYKRYKKAFKETIENSDSNSSCDSDSSFDSH